MSEKEVSDTDFLLDDLSSIRLSEDEKNKLERRNEFSDFRRQKLDKDAKKNWDLFYKRNGDRFFKNRHWTKREFYELFSSNDSTQADGVSLRYLLEIGCGCGDFVLPLLEFRSSHEGLSSICNDEKSDTKNHDLFIYCCDISDEAINILKSKSLYINNEHKYIKAFVADITGCVDRLEGNLDSNDMDIVSLIFVLSALDPEKMQLAVNNIYKITKPKGLILFRDYAIYDKAMLRFHESSKICDQFYVRQDGTRAYFFSKSQLLKLFENFHCESINYVKRETVNNATKDRFSRIFLQAKFTKQ